MQKLHFWNSLVSKGGVDRFTKGHEVTLFSLFRFFAFPRMENRARGSMTSSTELFRQGQMAKFTTVVRPCLVLLPCKCKKKIVKESYQFEVLNEVYLQNFLHRWVVNREMNLMMLVNP